MSNQNQMEILNSLCGSYAELSQTSSDKSSLEEIRRKQNKNEGLTNDSDLAFGFFSHLEIQCRQKITHENLVNVGKSLHHSIIHQLTNDSELNNSWLMYVIKSMTPNYDSECENEIQAQLSLMVNTVDNLIILFESIINLFLKVSLSQFRRDYLGFLKKEKGKALRKKVSEKAKKVTKSFDMTFFMEDKSKNKEASILRFKSMLIQNRKLFEEHTLKKKDLLLLCKEFKLKILPQKLKKDIIAVLVEKIPNLYTQRDLNVHTDSNIPGPSGISTPCHDSSVVNVLSADSAPSIPSETKRTRLHGKRQSIKGKGKGKGK